MGRSQRFPVGDEDEGLDVILKGTQASMGKRGFRLMVELRIFLARLRKSRSKALCELSKSLISALMR